MIRSVVLKSILATGASLVLLLAPGSASAQATSVDTTAQYVDRIFSAYRTGMSPGCAVGVSRNGTTVLDRAYGLANLETNSPNGPNTVFHAASVSKQFTAMAVMLLVNDGKLSLDDNVRKFVPELPDYGTPITVRQLLTHTSGIRDFFEVLILARGRFEENRVSEADMLDVITRQRSLNFRPGAEYLYSNSGYGLLAVIVKRVSGQSLRDFAAQRIFAPLGMTHTQFREDFTALVPGRAFGYDARGTTWRTSAPNYDVYGPTGLLTTTGDLLKWAANFDGLRVGDVATIRAMSTRGVLTNGDSITYGLGVDLTTDRGARVQEHGGSDPGFQAYLGRYTEHGLAIAVLCNTRSANAVALGHAVATAYLDTLLKPNTAYPLGHTRVADSTVSIRRAGPYFQPTRIEVVELTWRDGALYTARRGGRKLIPLDEARFQVEGLAVLHTFGAAARTGYVASSMNTAARTVPFEWRAPFVFTPGVLERYVGKYRSVELNAAYEVTASDSTILIRSGTTNGITARPVFGDTFVSGQITIEFQRTNGRITALLISHPRARRLRFDRAN